jgi:hypothetical protein
MLRAQGDLALDAHLAQGQVDIAQTAAAAGDMDMGQRQVIIEGEFSLPASGWPLRMAQT